MKATGLVTLALAGLSFWSVAALAQDADAARVKAGHDLAFDRGKGNCIACHAFTGTDVRSSVGPELSAMRARFPQRADLVAILVNEQSRNPQTVMPPFGQNRILSPAEIEAIVDFLYSL
jgi:sulfur-oxidizing protein SoxX